MMEEQTAISERHNPAILVVSFGTSNKDSLKSEIGAIEQMIAKRFPDYEVRRAFASQFVIERIKKRDGQRIDSIREALERAATDGIMSLAVQPTYLLDGNEYSLLTDILREYKDKFDRIVLGEPLLKSDDDLKAVAQIIAAKTADYDNGSTAVCFMGHGTQGKIQRTVHFGSSDTTGKRNMRIKWNTDNSYVKMQENIDEQMDTGIKWNSNSVYAKIQEKLINAGFTNHYIAAMQAEPSFLDILTSLRCARRYKRVVLMPLMVAAGKHAEREMAGNKEDSWKSMLEREGYEVVCIMEGLGQIREIQEIYAAHAQDVVGEISGKW